MIREVKKTILERARRDPEFRSAILNEAINELFNGDLEVAKSSFRDYVDSAPEVLQHHVVSKLTWRLDPERNAFVIIQEELGDNPREVLDFESLYDGDDRTVFGVCLVVGPLTGGKSYRLYSFDGNVPSVFGMGGDSDKLFAQSACEYEYLRSVGRIQHPFEDQLKR